MFGHQNNDQANSSLSADQEANMMLSNEPQTVTPTDNPALPVSDPTTTASAPTNDYVMTDLPHLAAPAQPAAVGPPSGTPMVGISDSENPAVPTDDSAQVDLPEASDLIELKQSALQELSPLVGHLEQTPEEKFRTTMMMIQASDDQSMLPAAFEAAKAIEDEKARAQALLDVINEINYFTQQHATTK